MPPGLTNQPTENSAPLKGIAKKARADAIARSQEDECCLKKRARKAVGAAPDLGTEEDMPNLDNATSPTPQGFFNSPYGMALGESPQRHTSEDMG